VRKDTEFRQQPMFDGKIGDFLPLKPRSVLVTALSQPFQIQIFHVGRQTAQRSLGFEQLRRKEAGIDLHFQRKNLKFPISELRKKSNVFNSLMLKGGAGDQKVAPRIRRFVSSLPNDC